jgi:predicted GH43/DUF377 family glycosyl hydrolase
MAMAVDYDLDGSAEPESDGRLPVHRSGAYLRPDNSRMLLRPFHPQSDQRAREMIERILTMSPAQMEGGLATIMRHFSEVHADIETVFVDRCRDLSNQLPPGTEPTRLQSLVIGAYFMSEYSLQSAALFNPSIVPHPDQDGVPSGALRFVMSLRATGEGHISSIEFRSGFIDEKGELTFDPVSASVTTPVISYPRFRKVDFLATLSERGLDQAFITAAFGDLPPMFEPEALETFLQHPERWPRSTGMSAYESEHERNAVGKALAWATHCDYLVAFPQAMGLSERVIFPNSPSEKGGIEDARFVQFEGDDGGRRYFATYTAFDGANILPQLIETDDFLTFRLRPLHGAAAGNKGMALFPRRIDGRYAMLGRQGGVNITFMLSDDVHHWDNQEVVMEPEAPWEYVQIGNCGSPLETDAGWLVLTHGVGPMRNYCIGAALLDLDDPRRVIGRLKEPLLEPLDHERDGYVPNVVYSCGSLIHNGWLILPYAISDFATTSARIRLDPLLERLVGP